MTKNGVVISYNNKPIDLLDVKTFTDATEFLAFKKGCEKNKAELEATLRNVIENVNNEITNLNKKLKEIQTELAYNRGEITKKEYDEICGIK